MNAPQMVSQLRARIESILLVADNPVTVDALASALGAELGDVEKQLEDWSEECELRGSGIDVRRTAEGLSLIHI